MRVVLHNPIVTGSWFATLALLLLPWTAHTQPVTTSPVLRASLNRLSTSSSSWRSAVAEIEQLGRRVVVVTPEQVRVINPDSGRSEPFDESVVAEVQPVADADLRVEAVVVVINVPLLEKIRGDSLPIEFEADLDRIVAHEVYGHAIPYLLAGHLSGRCPDPQPGQRASESCAIQRENEIRAELRLGRRTDYGLTDLAISRRLKY